MKAYFAGLKKRGSASKKPGNPTATVAKPPKRNRKKADQAPHQAALNEIDREIAIVRDNLRELTEQAAAFSGARDEELAAERIAAQEAQLTALTKRRDSLLKAPK